MWVPRRSRSSYWTTTTTFVFDLCSSQCPYSGNSFRRLFGAGRAVRGRIVQFDDYRFGRAGHRGAHAIPFVQEVVASTAYGPALPSAGDDPHRHRRRGRQSRFPERRNAGHAHEQQLRRRYGAFIDQMALLLDTTPPDSTVWRSGPSAFIRLPRGAAFSPKRTSRTCWPKT